MGESIRMVVFAAMLPLPRGLLVKTIIATSITVCSCSAGTVELAAKSTELLATGAAFIRSEKLMRTGSPDAVAVSTTAAPTLSERLTLLSVAQISSVRTSTEVPGGASTRAAIAKDSKNSSTAAPSMAVSSEATRSATKAGSCAIKSASI
eukprot:1053340-Prymnesium_polylepis.1